MILYRALPKNTIVFGETLKRHSTSRLPSNVPYFVDNLWEFFRPDDKPSLRFAVYASPTPELALQNASIGFLKPDEYEACIVEPQKPLKVMQLGVKDAREHADIRRIQKFVHENYYENNNLEYKKSMSILFSPGISKSEMTRDINPLLNDFLERVAPLVTMWRDVASTDGELFFEIEEDNSYQLKKIEKD